MPTPTGRSSFEIQSFNDDGIEIDKLTQRIKWSVLDGVPDFMASHGGEIEIGAIHKGWGEPGTLERFLKDGMGNQLSRASYVAPLLEEAGVCEILPKEGNESQRIRLKLGWRPSA